jgi:feruloyl-CoA synthase
MSPERDPARLFAAPGVEVDRRPDGTFVLRSPRALHPYARCLGEYLEYWGHTAPKRPFLLERDPSGRWRELGYGAALASVRRIAAALLRLGLSAERPLAILADNSLEVALLTLAGMHVGVPVAPVSPAYSLMSRDFVKLRHILAQLQPGLIYVSELVRFAPAIAALGDRHAARLVAGGVVPANHEAIAFASLETQADEAAVDRALLAVGPDTIAKLLFTSGSTDEPKGVINTQRMLCANQQQRTQTWPFLERTPPVILDWLPWSHTFGGNHNFNAVLRHGGTLYIDAGRPVTQLFEHTIGNLSEIAPTVYFNVPRGYDMLVAALRMNERLRRNFFSRLQVIFYAAAALPQHLWEALTELAHATVGQSIPLVSAWGSTETAPLAADCHFQAERSGVIGLPVPGCELKLVPNADKLEVRVRGPQVTPGYWRRPDLTANHFDAEGFYRIGDAVRFVDPRQPVRGLVFDGRVSEDFKLDSGTWVNVGALRLRAIAALAPLAQDVVLAGRDRAAIGLLIFPDLGACRRLCGQLAVDAPAETVLAHPEVRTRVSAGLAALRDKGGGSSTFATRAVLLAESPSIDAGEITDKGYINQHAVLRRRAACVEQLYADPLAAGVVVLPGLANVAAATIVVDPCDDGRAAE